MHTGRLVGGLEAPAAHAHSPVSHRPRWGQVHTKVGPSTLQFRGWGLVGSRGCNMAWQAGSQCGVCRGGCSWGPWGAPTSPCLSLIPCHLTSLMNDPLLPHPGQSEPICASQGGLQCPLLQEDLLDFPSRRPWTGHRPAILPVFSKVRTCLSL